MLHLPFRRLQLHENNETVERRATWLELFFDLVLVVAITQLSERLSYHFNFAGILQFIALFIPVTWIWMGHTVYATRFDTDDSVHRGATFFIMFAVVIMTVQIPQAFAQGADVFAIGYVLARLVLLFLYLRVFYYVSNARKMALLYLIGFGFGVSCWCISLFFIPPIKFWLWGIGLTIDFLTPWIGKKRILSKLPLDTRHIPERLGLFTIIVLGESIAAVILGLTHTNWHFSTITAGILAFILAILLWLQYYSYMQVANYKCSLNSGQSFIYIHFPLVISLAIISVCAEHMISAAAPNALVELRLNIIFVGAVILWLLSFFLIQYISLANCKIKLLKGLYAIGIGIILAIFLLASLTPIQLLICIDIIFACIIGIERYFRERKPS